MSYENEIKHLMRELKFAKSDYLNARLKSEDALRIHAFKTDVETIEFQIEVFEKATKADEYEAKAKAYDSLKNNLEKEVEILIDEVSGFPYVDAPIESTISHFEHVLEMMKNYKSGGYDDKK